MAALELMETPFKRLWRGYLVARVFVALLLALGAMAITPVLSGPLLSQLALLGTYGVSAMLYAALSHKPPPQRRVYAWLPTVGMDLLLISPSQRIDAIAARHVDALPGPVQRLFVGLQPNSVTQLKAAAFASYLLFETPFTEELIALGRADTLARRSEVCAFFGWPQAASGADSRLSMRTASSTPS